MIEVRKFKGIDLFAFTCCSTIALGVTFLPYVGGDEVRSAWLKVMIAVLPYLLLFFLLKKFSLKYDSYDFFLEVKNSTWKWVYWVILLYFIVSTFIAIIFGLEALTLITKVYLLPNTEQWTVLLLFIAVAGVGLAYGITAISRFVVALIFVEFILLFSIIFLGFSEYFRWIYIPPILTTDITTLLKSSISDMARYSGVIALLGFLPYLNRNCAVFRPMSYGILLVVAIYVAICIVILGTFGFEQSLTLVSPFTALVQSVSTRTGVVERVDLFFLGVWIIAYYKIMLIQAWFLLFLLQRFIPIKKPNIYLVLSLGLLFFVSVWVPGFVEPIWVPVYLNQLVYSLIVPTGILIILILKRKKGDLQSETS
ncbi:GerAB/ArcD/ProY family transporter [Anaerobacillus sp. CMMVII]|uniref:GerAB/ArcD/ProY family transporter n=1 Tax=Anaerobacillus sp. CMMVII TaxID=2755588 RepID=UPI0021B72D7F|nr:GerAB/ArcD/ProY family transporter [Anaerobacillus sp. CMMVII]MCT8136558.1 GerAB/ArcD/ProY family transporter [Anaerobacillus sp. CMMVII]